MCNTCKDKYKLKRMVIKKKINKLKYIVLRKTVNKLCICSKRDKRMLRKVTYLYRSIRTYAMFDSRRHFSCIKTREYFPFVVCFVNNINRNNDRKNRVRRDIQF